MPRNDPEYERGFTDGFNAGTRFQAERTPPSDAEQLIELRKAAESALKFAAMVRQHSDHPNVERQANGLIDELQAALKQKRRI